MRRAALNTVVSVALSWVVLLRAAQIGATSRDFGPPSMFYPPRGWLLRANSRRLVQRDERVSQIGPRKSACSR